MLNRLHRAFAPAPPPTRADRDRAAIEALAPAPVEGEAREWTLYVCDGCGWASSIPDDDPNCDCSCGEHEEPPPIRRVTVREVPAPTDTTPEGTGLELSGPDHDPEADLG